MMTEHPIQSNRSRTTLPHGDISGNLMMRLDRGGRVQCLRVMDKTAQVHAFWGAAAPPELNSDFDLIDFAGVKKRRPSNLQDNQKLVTGEQLTPVREIIFCTFIILQEYQLFVFRKRQDNIAQQNSR
ncbi:MAG: hypothetical protein U9R57_14885 [Thermodesulfobacteriota bacterium]|nr:hypothetical protein [Thermodesulfobacteriota bacterium]